MSCKLRVSFDRPPYTCEEVRQLKDSWLAEYRKNNRTDEIIESGMEDRRYNDYRESIDRFLRQCKCLDECPECKPEDHEGTACRHEMRNIELAKIKREIGDSPWKRKNVD